MDSINGKILRRFSGHGKGHVATPADFLDLGSREGVDKALSRLATSGKIRRIGRGMYELPKTSRVVGRLSPNPEKVAKAYANREGLRLQPTGAYAANRLRLTEQVPMRVVFLTDGSSRKIEVDNRTIELRKASHKRMRLAGKVSGLVFEALRHIGKDHVGEREIRHLRDQLTEEQKRRLLRDLPFAPIWMQPILREVAGDNEQETDA